MLVRKAPPKRLLHKSDNNPIVSSHLGMDVCVQLVFCTKWLCR